LALIAAQAGAKKVYAVERTRMAQFIRRAAKRNGVADRVTVLEEDMLQYWIPYPGFPTKGAVGLLSIGRRALVAARRLDVPALVVQSRTDDTVNPRSATILARALGKKARVVWLDDSIHVAVLDRERHVIAAELLKHLQTE